MERSVSEEKTVYVLQERPGWGQCEGYSSPRDRTQVGDKTRASNLLPIIS